MDCFGNGSLASSRQKLHDRLRDMGFDVDFDDEKPMKRWWLRDDCGHVIRIEIFAHRSGDEASYKICNNVWNPLM